MSTTGSNPCTPLSYRILSYTILSYRVLSFPVRSYPILPIVLFWSTHTECECSSEPVPMFLTTRVIVLHHFPYLGPADKGLLYTFPTSKWLFSCARAPTRGTSWAESGILFDEPDVLHSSYPAMSSQILFTTTTYGCLHVEQITACHFFYTST